MLDRRSFFAFSAGAAGGLVGRGTDARCSGSGPGIEAIASAVIETDRDAVPAALEELRGRGAGWRDLLGGVFLAGVREIEPRPVGFKLHAVLMTSSAYQICEAVPEARRMLPVVHNALDFKRSQRLDAERGDWKLAPASRPAGVPLAKARAAFDAAMDAWDSEAADAATVELCAAASIDEAFESLWRYGARDFTNIGHKIIYTAQAYRTLQQIGWRHGEPVIRSLVCGLLHGEPGENDGTFSLCRELGARVAQSPVRREHEPEPSLELLQEMRSADAEQAARLVAEAVSGGRVAAAAVWDGLRLLALEILMRSPSLLTVHPITTLNAFRYAFERTRDDRTRWMLLTQAASWSASFRVFFEQRAGYDAERPGIDAMRPVDGATAAAAFEAAHDDRDRAAGLAAGLVGSGGLAALAAEARELLIRKFKEHHDYKYTAAVLEEIALAHPRWQPTLAGAAMYYLRTPGESDSPIH